MTPRIRPLKFLFAAGGIAFLPTILFGAGAAVQSEIVTCASSPFVQKNSVLADATTRRQLTAESTFAASVELVQLCMSRSNARTAQRLGNRATPSWRSAQVAGSRPPSRAR